MLGGYLVKKFYGKYDVYGLGRSYFDRNFSKNYQIFDFEKDEFNILRDWTTPDIIIHCGALTNLEECEKNPKKAFEVNSLSVKNFLEIFPNSKMIFISSDAVFPDIFPPPKENSTKAPLNVYGKSKDIAEEFLSKRHHLIIRTTIVGLNINVSKQSFTEWIINSVRKNISINLFEDVYFNPITIWDLGKQIEKLIDIKCTGIFHIASKDSMTKYDFAIKLCKALNLNEKIIKSTRLANFNSAVKRSRNQTLDSSFYEKLFKIELPKVDETINLIAQNYMNALDEQI